MEKLLKKYQQFFIEAQEQVVKEEMYCIRWYELIQQQSILLIIIDDLKKELEK